MPLFNKSLFRLFLVFFIIYATFARVDGWVENSRLDLTRAIVDEGRFNIDTYANNTGDRAYYKGHYYSDKFPGASFLAVPPYFVFKHIFGTPSINDNFYETNPDPLYNGMVFFVIIFTSALLSALTVVLVYKTASFFTKKKSHKYIAAVSYGLGTIAFNYATLFYDHAISTFFSFACFYIVYRNLKKEQNKHFFLAGLFGGFAIITTPITFLIVLFCFMLVLSTKNFKNIIKFFVGSFLIVLFLFFYNKSVFDDPLDVPYYYVDGEIFGSDFEELYDSGCFYDYFNEEFFSIINKAFLKLRYDFLEFNFPCNSSVVEYYSFDLNHDIIEYNSLGEEVLLLSYNSTSKPKKDDYLIKTNKYIKKGADRKIGMRFLKIVYMGKKLFNNRNLSHYSVFVNKELVPVDSLEWSIVADYYSDSNGFFKYDHKYGMYSYNNCSWLNKNRFIYDPSSIGSFTCEETRFYTLNGSVMKKMIIQINISNETLILDSENFNVSKFVSNFYIETTHYNRKTGSIIIRLLFYPYRGFFFYNPILIFSFIGLFFMYKRHKLLSLSIILLFVFLILYNSRLWLWWGGTSFGPRHLLPIIPFLMIPLLFSLKKIKLHWLIPFIIISVLINVVGLGFLEQEFVIVDEDVRYHPELWKKFDSWHPIGNPLFNHYIPVFIEDGPSSMLLEKSFVIKIPSFSNLLVILLITFFLWYGKILKVRFRWN